MLYGWIKKRDRRNNPTTQPLSVLSNNMRRRQMQVTRDNLVGGRVMLFVLVSVRY